MTTGGHDPNQDLPGEKPYPHGTDPHPPQGGDPYGPPPQGGYPGGPGGYPPPQGNYRPPPQGNYPPPGGYPPPPGGYPPPPPAYGAGYGADATGGSSLAVGDAIGYGWHKFKDNAGVWIGVVVLAVVIQIALNFVFGGFSSSSEFSLWRILGTVVTTVVGYLIQAALIRGALHEVDGTKPAIGSFFQFTNVGAIILASFLVGILTGIGFVLLVIPGLIIMFLTWWTLQFVIDQGQDAITAIKSSVSTIAQNAGTLILLALALIFLNVVGALLLLVGLLVTIPVTIIASTYAYRVVTGRGVAA